MVFEFFGQSSFSKSKEHFHEVKVNAYFSCLISGLEKNPKVDATTGIVLVKMNATVKFKIFMTFVVKLTIHREYLSPANNRSKAEIP